MAFLSTKETSLWHYRLGHSASPVVRQILNFCNIDCKSIDESNVCPSCQKAKSKRLPFQLSKSRTIALFEFIHSDLWGPSPEKSINGVRYFLLFIDDFTRYT